MKRRVSLAVLVPAICGGAYAQGPSQMKMTTYQLVVLKQGPNVATAGAPEGQKTLQAHIQFLYRQGAAGTYKAAGPFTDGGEIRGIIFVAAATPEEAMAIEAEDPGVKAGVFSMEAMPFMAPEGWFPGTWAEFGKFERVFFGFLNSGPDRTQDEETANRLQTEHLAYMTGQGKEGKLVVAGPFLVEGTRRGIVVYRVATPEEAQQRATGDPMVKAGRLAVELHPWQVPVGALPQVPK